MEEQERELFKKCADFLQRCDALEIMSFILDKNVSYTEIKEAWNRVYISPLTPFHYVELNKDCLYFELKDKDDNDYQKQNYNVELFFDDRGGSGTIKIKN